MFYAISNKISVVLLDKLIQNYLWKFKLPRIGKIIFNPKKKNKGLILKTNGYGHRTLDQS